MKLSFRRAKSTKKIATEDQATMDNVTEPRRNFFRSFGGKERAMSYSGPSMLTNVRPHEGGAGAHASHSEHSRPRPNELAPQQGKQRGDGKQEDGDEDDESCDESSEGETPAVIVLRRSTREIAEMQELLNHRELMMERRLSLPAEHPRSNLHDEMTQGKNQEGSSGSARRDRTDSIEVRRTDAAKFAVGKETVQFWHRTKVYRYHADVPPNRLALG